MSLVERAERFLSRYALVGLMVAMVTFLHYSTSMHVHAAHGIYRRLYYFPIIFAAFRGGWKAGLSTALIACAVYVPHALGGIGYDPGPTLEKTLEMVLYIAVGLVCGILVSRADRTMRILRETATQLQQALAEKSAMEGELVRSARLAAVGRLSAGLAHEIRNPLASITGAADIVADDFPSDHPKARLVHILGEESRRLNDVLTRFLAFARPAQRGNERFDLGQEIHDVVALVQHQARVPEMAVSFDTVTDWSVEGDREQIRQLLLNLLRNAAEAAGSKGRVEVSLHRIPGFLQCIIDDDGPGFSEEAVANFGTPFYTTKESGTGLGLAICQRIIEDHDGRISVQKSPRGGARISVELPLVVVPEPARRGSGDTSRS